MSKGKLVETTVTIYDKLEEVTRKEVLYSPKTLSKKVIEQRIDPLNETEKIIDIQKAIVTFEISFNDLLTIYLNGSELEHEEKGEE